MSRLLPTVLVTLLPSLGLEADDEKLSKRVDQLTTQLVKNLEELARKYDGLNDPEAAHLLASCAVGFGSKDPKIATIKGSREVDLFVGKLRGGEPLADPNPIDTALRGIATDAKKLLDTLFPQLKKGELSPVAKALVHDLVPKYEIARGAEEYIQATQRFNKLRRAMGLRAILWDFEKSRQLILACWYMGETDDYRSEVASDKASPLYSDGVELAKQSCSRPLYCKLREFPDTLRPYAFIRCDVLNPDARQLWLAHWAGGKEVDPMTAYAIPQVPYRADIPTPSQRYTSKTVVEAWPGWKDTEDTLTLGGERVPVVRYPYVDEPDAPPVFSNGRGAMEGGWAKSEHDFLAKAGVPIMLRIFARGKLSNIEVSLKARSGRSFPMRVYLNGDPRANLEPEILTVLAVPEAKLEDGTDYTVHVAGTAAASGAETPFERTWSFKTRAK